MKVKTKVRIIISNCKELDFDSFRTVHFVIISKIVKVVETYISFFDAQARQKILFQTN